MEEANFDRIKERFDLLAEIERDLGPGRRSGRWVKFSCPFPGHAHGDQDPSLGVTPDNGRYHCFTCGASGDVLTWMHKYREQPWKEILAMDDHGDQDASKPKPRPESSHKPKEPPGEAWQSQAFEFAGISEQFLWAPEGEPALQYLYSRGLTKETIESYRLGFWPFDDRDPRVDWGLPESSGAKDVWLPRAIVIPCFVDRSIWYINMRRNEGKPKYYKIPGSKAALFGADFMQGAEILVLTEGEFDCMIADQEFWGAVGVATLGGNTTNLDLDTWGSYLIPVRHIVAAYDVDGASEKGLRALVNKSAQIQPIQVPVLRSGDKDINDYFLAGGDLWEWMRYNLVRLGILDSLGISPAAENSVREVT